MLYKELQCNGTPDEKLSYSELKDRIREECGKALPKKERVLLMAKKLEEEDLTLKDTICNQICSDLKDVTSEQHIRKCLPDEYKQHRRKNVTAESTGELRNTFVNDGKNVPEQKTMTVDTQGYEESFEDTDRGLNVKPASEIVESLKKKLADVTSERDSLSNENKIIREKTQPELLHGLEEKFYDQPGLLDAKQLQKISEKAGRDLETIVQRYNTIIQNAVDKGGPVPLGTYIITKPDMKLVPVRIFVNFDKKKIVVSLWEKKLM